MRGLLHRHIPVRLINVSGSGFLLVCNERMAAGTTGVLRVSIDGTLRHSPARVARSTNRPYGMAQSSWLAPSTRMIVNGPSSPVEW